MSPRHAFALVACMLAAGVAGAEEPRANRGAPTDVVVTVGDTPIFRSEVDAVLRRAASSGPPPVAPGGDAPVAGGAAAAAPERRLEAVAIEQLIDQRLLRTAIEREQIVVGRLEVDGRLDQLKKQVAARGGEWRRFLEQTSRDEAAIREQIEFEIGLDKLIRPKLTPAALAAGFERHRREIDGTRLRVSHVVLRPDAALGEEGVAAATARAAAIRREVVQGATTFADAAKRYSAGPSRLRGGDLGWITRDAPLLDAFAKQAFTLAKGDVSKPFLTPFGVHIVQVVDIESGRATLDVLRPKLESLLASAMLRETLARLRATTPVLFAAGVPHFDPADPVTGDGPRRVVVGDSSAAASGPPRP